MTRIVECDPGNISIGMKVEVRFHKLNDDFYLTYLKPVQG